MTERARDLLIESVKFALGELEWAAKNLPSRELSLAITKMEESIHWLQVLPIGIPVE